jgi:hypothetical protein
MTITTTPDSVPAGLAPTHYRVTTVGGVEFAFSPFAGETTQPLAVITGRS